MGRYFNPATEDAVKNAGGRRLAGRGGRGHAILMEQVEPGESLAIHLDRVIFTQVADVTNRDEFNEFFEQVQSGRVLLLGFFAIPTDKFN